MPSSAPISAELAAHFAYLEGALAAAREAPLSTRRALLAALLADAFADRLFATMATDGDILAWRAELAAETPELALVFALAAMRPDGPRLALEAVEVPLGEYGALAVEDFMVSLYNQHSVQRVHLVAPDGTRHDAHAVIEAAVAALDARARTPNPTPGRTDEKE